MNYFALSGLLIAIAGLLSIGAIALHGLGRKNVKGILYHLALSVWGFFYFLWLISPTAGKALHNIRIAMMGAIMIPPLLYQYILSFFSPPTRWQRTFLIVGYIASIVCVIGNTSPLFIRGVERRLFFTYWPVPGPLLHVNVAMFISTISLALVHLYRNRHFVGTINAHYLKIATSATIIAYLCGSTNYFLWYNIPIAPFPNMAIPALVIVTTYAYLKSELLDVKQVALKLSLILLIYTFLGAAVLAAAFPTAKTMLENLSTNRTWILLTFSGVAGILFSTGPLIYASIVRRSYWLRSETGSGLVHELKTPVSAIQAATDIAIESLLNTDEARSRTLDYLHLVKRNAERLDVFVKELLDLAKIQSDETELTKELLNFSDVVAEVIHQQEIEADRKGVLIEGPSVGTYIVKGDRRRVQQVVSNVLSNAIKFTNKGQVKLDLLRRNGLVLCTVADTGRGIRPEHLSRIFDRFFQCNQGTKGSGLGLAIAKAWVEAHGGRIWAESEGEGKGTTVTFTLPAIDNP